MEILAMLFAMIFFPSAAAFWLYISKKYSVLRRFRIVGVVLILLPAALGAVSISWWMFVQEPLYSAASDGDTAKVEALLKRGANPNVESDEGPTALEMAAKNGHQGIVEILRKAGANK